MTGNDYGNRISMICSADSAYSFRISCHGCLLEIVPGFSEGNLLERLPRFLLKVRSMELEWNRENFSISSEIFWQFFSHLLEYRIISFLDSGTETFFDRLFLLVELRRIREIKQYECIIFRDSKEVPHGTWYNVRRELHACIISIFPVSSSESFCDFSMTVYTLHVFFTFLLWNIFSHYWLLVLWDSWLSDFLQ